jgi:pimeloyl-ACP methyl ester carboxylesterase
MVSKQEIININGIPTHIYQLGNSLLSLKNIVIIPGNPGLGAFYIPFAHELYNLSNENISILIISQAGHSPPLKKCFTLNEQIKHKLDVIEKFLPINKNHRLILIGHSIGAYMVLKMLEKLQNRFDRAFCLFPTIERMKESQAGKRFVRWYTILIYILPFLCWLINLLFPFIWLKRKILSYYFLNSPLEDRSILIDTVLYDLLNPLTIKNLLQMANEEMFVVNKRNDDIIKRYLNKITFYYGTNDHWVPNDIPKQMKNLYPKGDIIECTNKYMHAFVLRHSKELAKIVFHKID